MFSRAALTAGFSSDDSGWSRSPSSGLLSEAWLAPARCSPRRVRAFSSVRRGTSRATRPTRISTAAPATARFAGWRRPRISSSLAASISSPRSPWATPSTSSVPSPPSRLRSTRAGDVSSPASVRLRAITNTQTPNAAGYFAYFGAAAGDPAEGYYSFDLGTWHVVVLNSNCGVVGGCGDGSPQVDWLRADLAAHPSDCALVAWHHPRFSSGQHGDDPIVETLWRAAQEGGADVVLVGHDHLYERFAPQDASGRHDVVGGLREFVVGTGGKNLTPVATVRAQSLVRISRRLRGPVPESARRRLRLVVRRNSRRVRYWIRGARSVTPGRAASTRSRPVACSTPDRAVRGRPWASVSRARSSSPAGAESPGTPRR